MEEGTAILSDADPLAIDTDFATVKEEKLDVEESELKPDIFGCGSSSERTGSDIGTNVNGNGFRGYQCQKCERIFSVKQRLYTHSRTHQECPKCGKKFSGPKSTQQRKIHMKMKRDCRRRNLPLICPGCTKKFKCLSALDSHLAVCKIVGVCDQCGGLLRNDIAHVCIFNYNSKTLNDLCDHPVIIKEEPIF